MKKISLTLYGLAVVALIGAIAMRSEAQQDSIANDEKATINESPSATSLPAPVTDPFEQAVSIIKKYEGMHQPRHWPLVGYGHKVLPGEKYSRSATLSEKQADALLRKDLLKNCAVFREYGADSLLLGTLAYNIGAGNVKRSGVTAALRNGNRDIRTLYLAHCRYRGKKLSQLQRRRVEEFETLFIVSDSAASTSQLLNYDSRLPGPVPYNNYRLASVTIF